MRFTIEKAPSVSVLMPVYNCAPFVDEAIECIRRQTFTDFEFLIVDDASTDDTWERLQKYTDPRIRLFRNETNKGLAQNLNELLEVAGGEFIARMDGDDACLLDRFELQVRYLQEHPDCGAVGSGFLSIDAAGRDRQCFMPPEGVEEIRRAMILRRPSLLHASSMMRREALAEIGGYRTRLGISEDYDLYLRMMERRPLGNVSRYLYRYRHHSGQAGARRTEQMSLALMATMFAIERRQFGKDSLDLMTSADLATVCAGNVAFPRLGNRRDQQRIMRETAIVTDASNLPVDALAMAKAMIRRWPLSATPYLTLAQILVTPVTYFRSYRRLRNGLGRLAYRVLRLR